MRQGITLLKLVHQIFDAVGCTIEQLDLVTYAHLTKKDLPRGMDNFLCKNRFQLLILQFPYN